MIESIKPLSEFLNKINEKLNTISKKLPVKKRRKTSSSVRKAKKIVFIKSIIYLFAFTISLSGITLLGYSIYDYINAKQAEKKSNYYIIKANLYYAKASLLKTLKNRKIKRKNIRRIVKILNGEDSFGRMYNFSPCDKSVLAYGESPYPGNVTIIKKYYNPYGFVLTAYNCKVEAIESVIIKIKKPPRIKKDKKKESVNTQNDPHTNIKPDNKNHNGSPESKDQPNEHNEKTSANNEKPHKLVTGQNITNSKDTTIHSEKGLKNKH